MQDSWQKRTPGTWELRQFTRPGHNGQCETIGEFPTFRAATEAARRIAKISNLRGDFDATLCRSHKRDGVVVDGHTRRIQLEAPTYDPDIELTLRDGRTMWLSDFEDECREAHVKAAALEQSLEAVGEGVMGIGVGANERLGNHHDRV